MWRKIKEIWSLSETTKQLISEKNSYKQIALLGERQVMELCKELRELRTENEKVKKELEESQYKLRMVASALEVQYNYRIKLLEQIDNIWRDTKKNKIPDKVLALKIPGDTECPF